MTREEIERLNKEFNDVKDILDRLTDLADRVHVAAEKAIQHEHPEGVGNGITTTRKAS